MLIPLVRPRSLRAYLDLGLGGLFLVSVAVGLSLHFYVLDRHREQAEEQIRALSRNRAQQVLIQVLLDQEVSLRGYLATGDQTFLEAYHTGLKTQADTLQAALDNLNPEDLEVARAQFDRVQRMVAQWHHAVALPLLQERGRGPLRDLKGGLHREKQAYEGIRAASEALVRFLDERDNRRLSRLERDLENARWFSLAALMGVLLAGYGFTRWLARRVADPLRDLADQAWAGDGFAEPDVRGEVREVGILGRALFDLDRRVRERESTLRQDQEEAQALQAFTGLVQQIRDEAELLIALEQALHRLVKPDHSQIFLRPTQGDGLEGRLPELPPEAQDEHRILRDAGACRAIRQGSPVELAAEAPTACLCALGVPKGGGYLCLPLVASGQVLGLVNLQWHKVGRDFQARRRLAEGLAQVSAAALQALRALTLAQEQAVRDGLTGVYNRRFLNEMLPRLVEQGRRRKEPLAALMLDIDHFKRFNDQFGHEVGDRVLVIFARTLQGRLRTGDLLARFGGEEFVALLPNTGLEAGKHLAERLRRAFETLQLPQPEFPEGCHITASIGVAVLPDHGHDGEDVLQAADKALYVAKGTGRNRVVGAEVLALPTGAPVRGEALDGPPANP